jgi:hypothetical protein
MCSPKVEIDSFIFGNDQNYENDGPSDSIDWDYSTCDKITVDSNGECIEHIDSMFYDSNGLRGLTYSTNQGNTGHVNQWSYSIENMRSGWNELTYTLDNDTVANQ